MKPLSVALILLVLALSPVEKQLVLTLEEMADKAFNTLKMVINADITVREEIIVDQYKILCNIKCNVMKAYVSILALF